ncbi:hypothetical protein Trydic_g16807 [Trypoxylus dichotomus]
MGNRCDYPYKQTPDVPEPDTADGSQRSLVRKEQHSTRRRPSGTTHGLHPKDSHPILQPSSGPLEPPRVGVSGLQPQDPLEVPSTTVTRRGPLGLTTEHPACQSPPRDETLTHVDRVAGSLGGFIQDGGKKTPNQLH